MAQGGCITGWKEVFSRPGITSCSFRLCPVSCTSRGTTVQRSCFVLLNVRYVWNCSINHSPFMTSNSVHDLWLPCLVTVRLEGHNCWHLLDVKLSYRGETRIQISLTVRVHFPYNFIEIRKAVHYVLDRHKRDSHLAPLLWMMKIIRRSKSDVWLTVHRNSVWIRKTN